MKRKQSRTELQLAKEDKDNTLIDTYPPADGNLQNILRSRFWINRMRGCYYFNPDQ